MIWASSQWFNFSHTCTCDLDKPTSDPLSSPQEISLWQWTCIPNFPVLCKTLPLQPNRSLAVVLPPSAHSFLLLGQPSQSGIYISLPPPLQVVSCNTACYVCSSGPCALLWHVAAKPNKYYMDPILKGLHSFVLHETLLTFTILHQPANSAAALFLSFAALFLHLFSLSSYLTLDQL